MPWHEFKLVDHVPVVLIAVSNGFNLAKIGTGARNYKALIDTGALSSVISPKVVGDLKPMEIGWQPLSRAGYSSAERTYHCYIKIGGIAVTGKWFSSEAFGVQPATDGVDVILGMDVLHKLDLYVFGDRLKGLIGYWHGGD